MQRIRCFSLPRDIEAGSLGENVVVIDVLRASTTICTALANGAACIYPFVDIESARACAAGRGPQVLTGGERGGEKIPGFDLGNSPLDYVRERVAGHEIAFTTTNGTRAMEHCRSARRIAIGAFCNRSAIVRFFGSAGQLDLVCAGTDGKISIEDCAFAGSVVAFWLECGGGEELGLGESENYCLQCWNRFRTGNAEYLRSGAGGANLMRLGRGADIEFAAQLDSCSVVPLLDAESWKIEPA